MMRRRRGYALIVLLALVAIGASAWTWVTAATLDDRARDRRTAAALALARDALIGRAAGDDTRPGSLPCPDVDNDGVADGPFGNCTASLGRLPWRTLGLAELRDGWHERLWYALSPNFRDNAAAGVLNSDTRGTLTIVDDRGTVLAEDAPAVIAAAGPALFGQTRGASLATTAAMYLEGENANGDMRYVVGASTTSFNDRVLILRREELFRPVVARVAREAQAGLDRYRATNGYYPPANPYDRGAPDYACSPAALVGRIPLTVRSGCSAHAAWNGELPDWFFDNAWHTLALYAVAAACIDPAPASRVACDATAGSEPLGIATITAQVRSLVIVSGPARGAQRRPCTTAADCVDDAVNGDGDRDYARPSAWPASNDRLAARCSDAVPCGTLP